MDLENITFWRNGTAHEEQATYKIWQETILQASLRWPRRFALTKKDNAPQLVDSLNIPVKFASTIGNTHCRSNSVWVGLLAPCGRHTAQEISFTNWRLNAFTISRFSPSVPPLFHRFIQHLISNFRSVSAFGLCFVAAIVLRNRCSPHLVVLVLYCFLSSFPSNIIESPLFWVLRVSCFKITFC